jgi:hypothetical protein
MLKTDPKININTETSMIIYKSTLGNSGTTLWNSGKEEKEKRMIEQQQYHNIRCEGRRMCTESC